ncbi:esterase, partial [Vibrio vulnificus]|uniref:alpha/beta hydrolase n=1 Tax=Vibrio vulnificus TaxID=672 RepID=UPI0005049161
KRTERKLLLTPARTQSKNMQPQGLRKSKVDTAQGTLTTYALGEAQGWELTHGWSGTARQFFTLMKHIASRGFTALAYDHPAHGESSGDVGQIPAFVEGVDAVLD